MEPKDWVVNFKHQVVVGLITLGAMSRFYINLDGSSFDLMLYEK